MKNKPKIKGLGSVVANGHASSGATTGGGGERSEPETPVVAPRAVTKAPLLDPEVPPRAQRRQFSAEYKRGILAEADRCREDGEIGALLRREGLYSSHLTTWRQQREEGLLAGLRPQKRGRKAKRNPLADRVEKLEHENNRLRKKLEQAEMIIGFQKKISELLGLPLKDTPPFEND